MGHDWGKEKINSGKRHKEKRPWPNVIFLFFPKNKIYKTWSGRLDFFFAGAPHLFSYITFALHVFSLVLFLYMFVCLFFFCVFCCLIIIINSYYVSPVLAGSLLFFFCVCLPLSVPIDRIAWLTAIVFFWFINFDFVFIFYFWFFLVFQFSFWGVFLFLNVRFS
jgi:hypothetical protein